MHRRMLRLPREKKRERTRGPASCAFTADAARPGSFIVPAKAVLCSSTSDRYNLGVLRALPSSGALAFLALVASGWVAGCATALGPGYIVEQQEVRVEFLPKQQAISISAEYRLVNSGNQDLDALEVRLPGRRFDPQNPQAFWDDAAAAITPSPDTPRNALVRFPSAWKMGEAHVVKFSYQIRSEP